MKFSVLLPTRNGGALLERCVRSVLAESYADMELVVSNNASEDETARVLERFADDPRLKVMTLSEPVEVTDNWNVALAESSGDFITLIGDDDLLLPGYFDRAHALLKQHGDPECLTFNAYAYAYPGFSGSQHAHFADPFYPVDQAIPRGAPVPIERRQAVVAEMFRFRFPMHLNMQGALFARSALARLSGDLFKPPFPDFYALNALFLRARSWVHTDEQLVVIGVSPKSFGRTVHSGEQDRALAYLGIGTDFDGKLPGSEILNGTYRTLLTLKRDYPAELATVEVDHGEYLLQQTNAWYVQMRLGTLRARDVARRLKLLRARDWRRLAATVLGRLRQGKLPRRLRLDRSDPAPQLWPGMQPVPTAPDIGEFATWIVSRDPNRD